MPDMRIVWAKRWDRVWAFWFLSLVVIVPMAAWAQHIQTTAAGGRWIALVFGAVVFPIGVIHGLAIWLGIVD